MAKSLGNLHKVGANILGFVLNQVPTKGARAANYGYYGQYYYASEATAKGAENAKARPSRRMKNAVPVQAPVQHEEPHPGRSRSPNGIFDATPYPGAGCRI